MRTTACFTAFVFLASFASAEMQDDERTIEVVMQVPSTAYKLQIQEVYQTSKELWVLSRVEGGKGIGLQVITTRKDLVKIKAPADLTVKHFVLGKKWNWGDEPYKFLKSRAEFDKLVKEATAKRIFERPVPENKAKDSIYIIMYRKEIFTNGKTKDGETLEQLARRHAKEFSGEVKHMFQLIDGCSMQLSAENASKLAKLPEVRGVEKDQ